MSTPNILRAASFGVTAFLFTSCGIFLQNAAVKNFNDPVTRTSQYKSLNGFQKDFLYLKTICEKYFPLADEYFPQSKRNELEQVIFKELARGDLTDLEFRLHLKRYLSHFHNQHTWISLKGISVVGIYPFIPYNQDSSWYILNTSTSFDGRFVGQKILSFTDIPVQDYAKQLFHFVSAENEVSKRKSITSWWYRPIFHEFLAGRRIDSVKLTFDNRETLVLPKITAGSIGWRLSENDFKRHPITKHTDRIYDYQIIDSLGVAYFQFNECYDKIEMKEGIKSYVKPWLRPIANLYVNMQTKRKKPSKRLKTYFDPERPVFSRYISKMIKETNDKGINKLIIDLRNNNGGSEMICLQLLYHLTDRADLKDFELYVQNTDFYKHYFGKEYLEGVTFYTKMHGAAPPKDTLFFAGYSNSHVSLFDKITDPESPYHIPEDRPVFKGKIVVLANSSTYSAGALFTALIQDNGIAKVIGTPVANNPTGPTTWSPFKLPNSKIEASISSHYLIRPDKSKPKEFMPDIYLEKSYHDLRNGKDPLFDKAIEILNEN
jgi:hypothetical protein